MIRTLFATTALVTLLASGAYAQDAATPAPAAPAPTAPAQVPAATQVAPSEGHLASNIIGESVYDGTSDDAQSIGKVKDLVITKDGQVQSMVVGVGGFLGIGDKNVAFDYDQASWAEGNGDRWLVVNTTKEALQSLPDFDASAFDVPPPAQTNAQAPGTMTPGAVGGGTAMAPATGTPPEGNTTANTTAPATDSSSTAAIDRSQLTEVPEDKISADELKGTTVYGADDQNIGEIGDVVLTQDGKVDAVIIDVGGFLGIGEKPVAVGMDNLSFMADADGNKYLYTSFTKDQLEAQTAYDKGTYAQDRDTQRMTITR